MQMFEKGNVSNGEQSLRYAKLYNDVHCVESLWAFTNGGPDPDLEQVAEDLLSWEYVEISLSTTLSFPSAAR